MSEEKTEQLELQIEDVDNDDDFTDLSGQKILTEPKDWTISTLFDKYQRGKIELQPEFQRKFVWDKKKASGLIESILLDFPLPVIYLSEEEDGKYSVIDGQQRLTTIFGFLQNKLLDIKTGKIGDFKLTTLKALTKLKGKAYRDLSDEQQNKIQDYSIRTILIKKDSGSDIKFDMFERLNCGSVALKDMELRNCIYHGPYMEALIDFAKNPLFRELVGLREEEPRMKDRELVLRFLAFLHTDYLKYSAPMKKFLNDDCEHFANYTHEQRKDDETKFKNALALINSIFGKKAFKRFFKDIETGECRWEDKAFNINVSLYDIYMWYFANKCSTQDKNLVMANADIIREATLDLMVSDAEFIDSITRATSGNKPIVTRFDKFRQLIDKILEANKGQQRCFTYKFKKELFEKDNTCALCGNAIQSIDDAAVDHIKQYAQGGTTTPDNARLTHRFCNDARSRKDN